MSKMTIIEGNSNSKDDVRVIMVKGEKGDVGPANTLSIGTVEKGENANATITGDAPNQSLNLVLPKGDKGDTGDKGEKGDGIPVNSVFDYEGETIPGGFIEVSSPYATKEMLSGVASPLIASSVSEMTDTSRVYVNTTDGQWYYYNGSSWVAGGTYQATVNNFDDTLEANGEMANSYSIGKRINDKLVCLNLFDKDNFNDNHYYNSYGELAENTIFMLSNTIYLKANEHLVFYESDGDNISLLNTRALTQYSIFNKSGVFQSRSNISTGYYFIAPSTGYYKFNIQKTYMNTPSNYLNLIISKVFVPLNYEKNEYKLLSDLDNRNDEFIKSISHQYNYFDYTQSKENYYINMYNALINDSDYFMTNPIKCEIGDVFNLSDFSNSNATLFQGLYYDDNFNFVERVSINALTYTTTKKGYIIFNCQKTENTNLQKILISKNETVSNYYNYGYIFDKSNVVRIVKNSNTSFQISFGNFDIELYKTVNTSTNANNWNVQEIKKDNNILVPIGTDIIGPVKINNNNDFIGGVHGDETTDFISITMNGTCYDDISQISEIVGNSLLITIKSSVYDEIEQDQAFDRFITILIKPNYIKISNNFKATKNLTLKRATNGGLIACRNSIIKNIMFNNSFFDTAQSVGVSNKSKENTFATINTIYGSITVNNLKGHENENYVGFLQVFSNENPMRNKIYFDTYKDGSYGINVGNLITGEFEYVFN